MLKQFECYVNDSVAMLDWFGSEWVGVQLSRDVASCRESRRENDVAKNIIEPVFSLQKRKVVEKVVEESIDSPGPRMLEQLENTSFFFLHFLKKKLAGKVVGKFGLMSRNLGGVVENCRGRFYHKTRRFSTNTKSRRESRREINRSIRRGPVC